MFEKSDSGEIEITCSNIAPEAKEENHFIAGEGGPSEIINATKYSVILSGRIALYRPETCPTPQISTHELLHALGFDHNNNPSSIMYPLTDCEQEIDESIIQTINSLYADPPYADLLIETALANKSGGYLNIDVTIANYGLSDVSNSSLILYADDKIVKEFQIGDFKIGTKRFLSATNIKIPRSVSEVQFSIETPEDEISKSNNLVRIKKLE